MNTRYDELIGGFSTLRHTLRRVLILALLTTVWDAAAQKVALKHNLAYDALLSPNLSLEVALAPQWTLDTQGGLNFFLYTKDATSPNYKTKKLSHWMVQPEVRYWTCEAFNGWFVGLHALGGQVNLGGLKIPFVMGDESNEMESHRYEGWYYGGGISAGYQWILSDHFNAEISIGAGYVRGETDKYQCTSCGQKMGPATLNYVGPTKATLSIVYLLK